MEPEVEGERQGLHVGQRNRRGQAPLLRVSHEVLVNVAEDKTTDLDTGSNSKEC